MWSGRYADGQVLCFDEARETVAGREHEASAPLRGLDAEACNYVLWAEIGQFEVDYAIEVKGDQGMARDARDAGLVCAFYSPTANLEVRAVAVLDMDLDDFGVVERRPAAKPRNHFRRAFDGRD